jgi:ribosome assembly protein YihI (activator of Der GTPase)
MPPEYFPNKQKALFDSEEFQDTFEAERQAHLNVAKLLQNAIEQDEMLKKLDQVIGMLESAEELGKDLKKHMEECIDGMDLLNQLMDLAEQS